MGSSVSRESVEIQTVQTERIQTEGSPGHSQIGIPRLEFPDCSRLLPGFVPFKIFTLFFCTEPTSPVGFFTASGLHGNCRLESATPVAHSCTLNRRVSVCAADASSSVLGRE